MAEVSRWNHSMCRECWTHTHPGEHPFMLLWSAPREQCCYCGKLHTSGIVIRDNPKNCLFNGVHEEEEGVVNS